MRAQLVLDSRMQHERHPPLLCQTLHLRTLQRERVRRRREGGRREEEKGRRRTNSGVFPSKLQTEFLEHRCSCQCNTLASCSACHRATNSTPLSTATACDTENTKQAARGS